MSLSRTQQVVAGALLSAAAIVSHATGSHTPQQGGDTSSNSSSNSNSHSNSNSSSNSNSHSNSTANGGTGGAGGQGGHGGAGGQGGAGGTGQGGQGGTGQGGTGGTGIGQGGTGQGGTGNGYGGSSSAGSDVNIDAKQVRQAPTVTAYANGLCGSGIGLSLAFAGFGGGVSSSSQDKYCLDGAPIAELFRGGIESKNNAYQAAAIGTWMKRDDNFKAGVEVVTDTLKRCRDADKSPANPLLLTVQDIDCSHFPAATNSGANNSSQSSFQQATFVPSQLTILVDVDVDASQHVATPRKGRSTGTGKITGKGKEQQQQIEVVLDCEQVTRVCKAKPDSKFVQVQATAAAPAAPGMK